MHQRLDESIDIAHKPELFGSQRRPGLVSLWSDRKGLLHLFRRQGSELEHELVEDFQPFLWLDDASWLEKCQEPYHLETLAGDNAYRYLVRCESWSNLKAVSDHIATVSGRYASHPLSPQLFLSDLATQYLLATGQTYFNKMAIEEVKAIALRVYTASDLPGDPGEDPDRLVAIAMREGREGPLHLLEEEDESKLLWRFRGKLKKLDPDLVVGHDLYKRDLELLKSRSKKHKVKQDWGRTEQTASGRRSRMMVAEKQLDYKRWKVPGREMLDSWVLAILHDVSGRELLGYDFEEVAAHFRLEVGLKNEPLELRAEKDTAALLQLHRTLLYPYFLQTQVFPLSFENVVLRGNATRINHLFLREYFRQGHSIPKKPQVEQFAGGLTAQEHEGCAYGVYHCDVASLYPSLIVSFKLGPRGDALEIFTGLLQTLRDFRFLAKSRQKDAPSSAEAAFFGNLQTTFKILINSFYGYLGFGQGHFADFERAAEVTHRGRELLKSMMAWLKERGAGILEVDTDGIYFVPSAQLAERGWIAQLDETLPSGVQVEFDGKYRAMYCHKMKNYALLEEDGNLILRGSGLRSRATEPYLRNFIEALIRTALDKGAEALPAVMEEHSARLEAGLIPIEELVKTETLIDSPATYAKKVSQGGRNRAAVYELALKAERQFRAGESLSYYIVGEKANVTAYDHCKRVEDFEVDEPDFNKKYYLKKLKAAYKKFHTGLSREPLVCPIPFEELPSEES